MADLQGSSFMDAPLSEQKVSRRIDVPLTFRAGEACVDADAARAYHAANRDKAKYGGWRRCRGCCLVDAVPTHVCFVPMCGGCCLWGCWSLCYVPCPLAPLVTCLCERGGTYVTEKAGVTTGELFLVDAEAQTLAFYGESCGGGGKQAADCYCTK